MAAAAASPWAFRIPAAISPARPFPAASAIRPQLPEFAGVFRGRELTRKDRKLASGIAPLDEIIGGGIPRGRISEIAGRPGSGRTSLAAAFAASATAGGEVVAWIDGSGAFDPDSHRAAGVDLARVLWAATPRGANSPSGMRRPLAHESRVLKAAEMVLDAGGFALVVVDFGDTPRAITQSAALRFARAAERGGAAVIAIASRRMCGTFAALSIAMNRARPAFTRMRIGAPMLFDGLRLEAIVARNKLGGSGGVARIIVSIDSPSASETPRDETPARFGDRAAARR